MSSENEHFKFCQKFKIAALDLTDKNIISSSRPCYAYSEPERIKFSFYSSITHSKIYQELLA